jgi:hypothetical protein
MRAPRLASCETTTESKAAFGEYQQLKDWAEHGRPIDLGPDPWTVPAQALRQLDLQTRYSDKA